MTAAEALDCDLFVCVFAYQPFVCIVYRVSFLPLSTLYHPYQCIYTVAVLCWGEGVQEPQILPRRPIFNWVYNNFA